MLNKISYIPFEIPKYSIQDILNAISDTYIESMNEIPCLVIKMSYIQYGIFSSIKYLI